MMLNKISIQLFSVNVTTKAPSFLKISLKDNIEKFPAEVAEWSKTPIFQILVGNMFT